MSSSCAVNSTGAQKTPDTLREDKVAAEPSSAYCSFTCPEAGGAPPPTSGGAAAHPRARSLARSAQKLRSVAVKATQVFGILMPDLGDGEDFEPIAQGIAHAGELLHHRTLGGSASASGHVKEQYADELCRYFISRKVSGVFFAPVELTAHEDDINRRISTIYRRRNSHRARRPLCLPVSRSGAVTTRGNRQSSCGFPDDGPPGGSRLPGIAFAFVRVRADGRRADGGVSRGFAGKACRSCALEVEPEEADALRDFVKGSAPPGGPRERSDGRRS